MNRFRQVQSTIIVCVLLVFAFTAASANMSARAGTGASASALVNSAKIPILVTAQGMTLYMLSADKKNQSTCTDGCAKFWPPLLLTSGATATGSIAGIQGAFGVAPRTGGGKQLTFNGSPLYTFARDKKPGDMNGEGVLGIWWAVVAAPGHGTAPATAPARLGTASMLVTGSGHTLYMFTQDKKNQSTCMGDCAKFWPPLLSGSGNAAPGAVPGFSGAFGQASRAGGGKQLTYNGAPLYTFVKDQQPGDTHGQGIGGMWWMVLAPAATTASLVTTAPARILVTAGGMTLYKFTADKKNQSMCTGDCAKFWPPLTLAAGAATPTSGGFGTAPLAGGALQLTFDGAPLYTFSGDKKPGDINGQGTAGKWWMVVASGATGNAPVKTATIQILVTVQGMTLYLLAADKKNQSSCTGACANFWPPLLLARGANAPTTIQGASGTFGIAPRAGSSRQVTYNGAPLYIFSGDKKPGDMHGEGIAGVWWIVAPAGQMSSASNEPVPPAATATAVPTATSTSVPSPTTAAAAPASASSTASPTATSTPTQVPMAPQPPTNTPQPTATTYVYHY